MTGIFNASDSLLWRCMRAFTKCTNRRTIENAAVTQVYCAVEPNLLSNGGSTFFVDCKPVAIKGSAADEYLCEALYQRTREIVREFLNGRESPLPPAQTK